MNSPKPNYRIYPSILDKFQELLDYQLAVEEPWNKVSETAVKEGRYPGKEEGDYILTPDEMSDKIQQELIDTINRVPHEPWEAADKGTAFNEIIDMLIANRDCGIEGMSVDEEKDNYRVAYNGFEWLFDGKFCRDFAQKLYDSASQVFTSATIETRYGLVELYGYIDEWQRDQVIDIKTTGSYDFLKFERKWQRHVYPYCLTQNGTVIAGFEYRVVKWKGGTKTQPAFSGEVIPEYYTYDHDQSTEEIREMVEHFLSWLELNHDKITDTKIFGADNDAGKSLETPVLAVEEDADNDYVIDESFRFLPLNLGRFDKIDDAIRTLNANGIFAVSESTNAFRELSEEDASDIRQTITDITENERFDAAKKVADALAFENRMKAEIKRRKEQSIAALNEIDERIMEKVEQLRENRKAVELSSGDTIRVSVSDKNLYYHLEDGLLVLASVSYASNDEMSGLFYQAEVNERAMAGLFDINDFNRDRNCEVVRLSEMADEELIGRTMACEPERSYYEDFINEDNGEVLSMRRNDRYTFDDTDQVITEEVLAELKDRGFNTIVLKK